MKMLSRVSLFAVTSIAGLTLIGCGGGSGNSTPAAVVATSDLSIPINIANKQVAFEVLTAATSGFVFQNGLPFESTRIPGPVNVTVSGTGPDNMTFTMVDGNKVTTTGKFEIGSCILRLQSRVNPTVTTPLTLNPCSVDVALAGKALTLNTRLENAPPALRAAILNGNGNAVEQVLSVLGGGSSLSLSIDAQGRVLLLRPGSSTPTQIGSVTVTAVTGAGS